MSKPILKQPSRKASPSYYIPLDSRDHSKKQVTFQDISNLKR